MKINIDDKEYTIKSRQAIEILDIVEKSGVLDKFKDLGSLKETPEDLSKLASLVPKFYTIAYDVLAIAMGSFSKGTLTKNDDAAEEIEAIKLPIYAIQIVKTLMFPISYAISDDPGMASEKKSGSEGNEETSLGKSESKEEPKG